MNWNIQHPQTKKWIPLGTKGSVQEALIANGYLPDPFKGDNEKLFAWVENFDWTFESVFHLDSISPQNEYDLDFPSIDTYAKIYLNGVLCGTSENSFVHYRFSVKNLLVKGKNTVKVVFQSPLNAKKKAAQTFVYPAPNDVASIKVAPYCRKPQYQFGWDWSIRMTTMGFWEPASLVVYQNNRVIGKSVSTFNLSDSSAEQNNILFLRDDIANTKYVWESKLYGTKTVQSWDAKVVRNDFLENPKLWWPRGQGNQYLYEDVWTLKTMDGKVFYHDTIHFGVRMSRVVQQKDQWGTSFVIEVNGRPMFCKGADYIPADIFPAKIKDEDLVKTVEMMAESNFNMVRIWGGGLYAQEALLDACDKEGIMVWHDFMFACSMYPGDDAFLKNVENELDQQIPRISSHASVVYFNGNNEVDVAWKNWGFQQTFHLSKAAQEKISEDYVKLFKELIPNTIQLYTKTPYVHTSPLSNWGKDEFYNNGTQHYWGVWHGSDPMSNMGTKIGRFNAEYGFQSFPEYSTLKTFSSESDWALDSKVMKQHQKSYVGNSMIAKQSDILFGKSDSFEEFVYFSQLTQAEAVETAVNAHRINKPRCSGTLFWQLNDCWPAISWSSVDYYGNWKALQYRIKASYEDVAILKDKTTNDCEYYLVSDIPDGYLVKIKCEVFDLKGSLIKEFECHRAVLNQSGIILQQELKEFNDKDCLIKFTWTNNLNKELEFTDLHLIKNSTETLKTPSAPIVSSLVIDKSTKSGTVLVSNLDILRDFWIFTKQIGVHFENNFVLLLPGTHTLRFTYSEQAPVLSDFLFRYR